VPSHRLWVDSCQGKRGCPVLVFADLMPHHCVNPGYLCAVDADLPHVAIVFGHDEGEWVEKQTHDEAPQPLSKNNVVGEFFLFDKLLADSGLNLRCFNHIVVIILVLMCHQGKGALEMTC